MEKNEIHKEKQEGEKRKCKYIFIIGIIGYLHLHAR